MLIGVPLETVAGETRVAVTPETAKKLVAQAGTRVCALDQTWYIGHYERAI